MYLLKNAFLNIIRTKGRNILIATIILCISISACLGLSIRQAAETAKEESLDKITITAQISIDRAALMQNNASGGQVDKSALMSQMNSIAALSLNDMLVYADAQSVKSFYYSTSIGLNGSEGVEPIDTNSTSSTSTMASTSGTILTSNSGKGTSGSQSDFTLTGYSSNEAMTGFVNGTITITEGQMYNIENGSLDCIISDELAALNGLVVGNTIVLTNPTNDEEKYILNIVGIYNNSQSTVSTDVYMRNSSTATDPANQIYLSYSALESILSSSEANSATALLGKTSGTYVFATLEDYNDFQGEVRELGLAETYAVSSSDVAAYEQSLAPLENLSTMAGYFLIVVLTIGALVLIVINIFNVRERKYEVGVLTAIGMKKWKVAVQFVTEILIITLLSVTIGGAVGAVTSVPVTNSLLESQVIEEQTATEEAFSSGNKGGNFMTASRGSAVSYISEVSSAVNMTVLLQLMGVFVLLAIIASSVSIIFIMRYEPLKILSNRD